MIEILILKLIPGTKEKFHECYVTLALPLLKKWKFNVLSYGPSLDEEDTFYVIRSFESLEHLKRSEDDFYSSDDWLKGPRDALFQFVENYSTAVITSEIFKSCIEKMK